jgi:hypothetical protein
MQEDQILNILVLQGDHNLHAIEALDVTNQQAHIVPLGEI